MKFIYFSETIIKGEKAATWSSDYGLKEQCVVLEPFYEKLSPKALKKLDRMAKGKGIYCFAVPKTYVMKEALKIVKFVTNTESRKYFPII